MKHNPNDYLKLTKAELAEKLAGSQDDYDRLVDEKDEAVNHEKANSKTALEIERSKYFLLETEKNEELQKEKNKTEAETARCGKITDEKDSELSLLKEKQKVDLDAIRKEEQAKAKKSLDENAVQMKVMADALDFANLKYLEIKGMFENYLEGVEDFGKAVRASYEYSTKNLDFQLRNYKENKGDSK
jgi:hypothetical protein